MLRAMENDSNKKWQDCRGLFDEFPPNNERKTASEWLLARYQVYRLHQKAKDGLKTLKGRFAGTRASSPGTGIEVV